MVDKPPSTTPDFIKPETTTPFSNDVEGVTLTRNGYNQIENQSFKKVAHPLHILEIISFTITLKDFFLSLFTCSDMWTCDLD